MSDTFEVLINKLTIWSIQTIELYWLVGVLVSAILVLTIVLVRNGRRCKRYEQALQEAKIFDATNTQKIDTLASANNLLTLKIESYSLKISELIAQSSKLQSSRDEKIQQLKDNEKERVGLREMHENDQRKISRMDADIREQQARLNAEQEKLVELKAQFEQQKSLLENEFKVVSERIIKDRQETLAAQNTEGVGALLKPLQEQINGFQKRVNEVHDESLKGNSSLRTEIDSVRKMGIQMRDEASNLTSALKGSSQQRGAWGEAQLERTLELNGLVHNDHYEKQNSFVDDEGKRKQTDYLVKLPGDKCIIIDSKVSLNAYERACSGEPEQMTSALNLHVAVVRTHIKDLASKQYTNLSELHSPDFILMFMPVESAYIEALKHDPELFSYGYNLNVILVSHTTLIPILRTVANLWMLDRSNKEARSIGEKANDIFNSVATVAERLQKLGRTLNTATTHYNDAVTSLSGNQGLQGKVKRFTELSSKANKTMPQLEQNHQEFDTQKLHIEKIDPTD